MSNWIEILPAEKITSNTGMFWINDNPELIIQNFKANKKAIPLDFENATELKGSKGEEAPAVGWVEELKVVDGAIHGRVNWNEHGQNAIESRSYRYLSPVFQFDKSTRSIKSITSIGLTNQPVLNMKALNRAVNQILESDTIKSLTAEDRAVCKMMGISEDQYAQMKTLEEMQLEELETFGLTDDERALCREANISLETFARIYKGY